MTSIKLVEHGIFPRAYRSFQLDWGLDMLRHPVTGDVLSRQMPYDHDKHVCYIRILHTRGGWKAPTVSYRFLPRIGLGQDVSKGDLFPAHWKFDPYEQESTVAAVSTVIVTTTAVPMGGWAMD